MHIQFLKTTEILKLFFLFCYKTHLSLLLIFDVQEESLVEYILWEPIFMLLCSNTALKRFSSL